MNKEKECENCCVTLDSDNISACKCLCTDCERFDPNGDGAEGYKELDFDE